MSITRIRVPSTWTVPCESKYIATETWHGMADFVLGVGPCGKTVERLEVEFTQYGVLVTQLCTCTERKEFVYPWHTVTGRVEITHA